MSKTFINLTPHAIVMNDGRTFPPSGKGGEAEKLVPGWSGMTEKQRRKELHKLRMAGKI